MNRIFIPIMLLAMLVVTLNLTSCSKDEESVIEEQEQIEEKPVVSTLIIGDTSQPIFVGGIIKNYSTDKIRKKGIIVGKKSDEMFISELTQFEKANVLLYSNIIDDNTPRDLRFIDCTGINEEEFIVSLLYLEGNTDYYVKAFAITNEDEILYGNIEKVHAKDFVRYLGKADYANVWHAFDFTLFDLMSDEIINPYKGFYYSTNENPEILSRQVGIDYNTCYKFATEWNYKLWYFHNLNHCDKDKIIYLPIMTYSNGELKIEKNPQNINNNITIYYSINGNYFRPDKYTDKYTKPIEISQPCIVYCYAISSDGYLSYTNMYVVGNYTINLDEDPNTDKEDLSDKEAEVVDLGLSVKWASWNVGTDTPEGLGYLYAWGEVEPKDDYSESTYKYYNNGYTKYGSIDNIFRLEDEDDVARQKWGNKWRIPTFEELEELNEKCSFIREELNGVPVTKVIGPNGNYIYFPYPGNFTGTTLYYENSIGSYWSCDLETDSYAKDIDYIEGFPSLNGDTRYHGQSIRPVYVEQSDEEQTSIPGKVGEFVDLGLSVKWASWNIGASSPEEAGCFFAWGETIPKKKYDWSTYKFGDFQSFTKYNSIDGIIQLELEDDAAYVLWGKDWRMPTHEEELELVNNCSWEDIEINGISGYKITGPNGNSIFMPRGGLYDGTDYACDGTILSDINIGGWYWSSTLISTDSSFAQGLCFFPLLIENVGNHERCDGHNIRPVQMKKP